MTHANKMFLKIHICIFFPVCVCVSVWLQFFLYLQSISDESCSVHIDILLGIHAVLLRPSELICTVFESFALVNSAV